MAMFAASKPNIKTGGWCPNMHGHDSFTADFWFNSSLSTPVRKPLFLCNGHHRFHSEKKSQPQPLCSPIIKHHLGTPSNHFTRQLRKRHCWRSEQKRGVLLTVSGSIALCSTSRGTNRRHRLLGNFSPPARLQLRSEACPAVSACSSIRENKLRREAFCIIGNNSQLFWLTE